MNRQVPVRALRGSDPTLLEVQLSELLRLPIGQIAPINVMDLVELADTEGRPKNLDRSLQGFVEKIRRQIADIPKGRSWDTYLDDLGELGGGRVPLRFRQMLADEAEAPDRDAEKVRALLQRWEGEAPEPFELGINKARIQRAEMVQPRSPAPEPSAAPRERSSRTRSGGSSSSKGGSGSRSSARPKPVVDIARRDFVIDQCMERLGRTSDKGLAEAVLVAGVRHAGKETYPDLTPLEITGILRQLKETNRVRYSAGRWSLRF